MRNKGRRKGGIYLEKGGISPDGKGEGRDFPRKEREKTAFPGRKTSEDDLLMIQIPSK